MIFDQNDQAQVFVAPSDPLEPKTQWSVRALTYRETLAVQADAGLRPMEAMDLFGRTYAAPEGVEESDDERRARIRRQSAAAKLYGEHDKQLLQVASEYIDRYDFAVCSYGVTAVDGRSVTHAELVRMLDSMRPRSVASVVLAEISGQIGALSRGDDAKK